jgi:hypothetical protein
MKKEKAVMKKRGETKLRIIQLMLKRLKSKGDPITKYDLYSMLGKSSRAAMYHHVDDLCEAKIIEKEGIGYNIFKCAEEPDFWKRVCGVVYTTKKREEMGMQLRGLIQELDWISKNLSENSELASKFSRDSAWYKMQSLKLQEELIKRENELKEGKILRKQDFHVIENNVREFTKFIQLEAQLKLINSQISMVGSDNSFKNILENEKAQLENELRNSKLSKFKHLAEDYALL